MIQKNQYTITNQWMMDSWYPKLEFKLFFMQNHKEFFENWEIEKLRNWENGKWENKDK